MLYISYLYLVRRDVTNANKIARKIALSVEDFTDFKIHNKIYIQASLELGDLLTIKEMGSNSKELLGYEKGQLLGRNVSSLMPSCISKSHESYIYDILKGEEKGPNFFIWRKSIIISHRDSYYLPANLNGRFAFNSIGDHVF